MQSLALVDVDIVCVSHDTKHYSLLAALVKMGNKYIFIRTKNVNMCDT